MRKVIVIAGVTASGKSSLSIEIAKKYNGEIISADSVAIYKELDIGSAKLSLEEQDGVAHHLMDLYPVDESYDVAKFQSEARTLIDDISARGKIPIIVGGTGLYINALIYNYDFKEEVVESKEYSESNEELHHMLYEKHPKLAETIHPNNRKRVIRALERGHENEKTFTVDEPVFDALVFFLQGDRVKIYDRINQRVDVMFQQGLVKEVTDLKVKYDNLFCLQSVQSIGYREFEMFFNDQYSLEDTKDLIKRNTRRLAKRQMTWFKHQTKNITVDIFEDNFKEKIFDTIDKFI